MTTIYKIWQDDATVYGDLWGTQDWQSGTSYRSLTTSWRLRSYPHRLVQSKSCSCTTCGRWPSWNWKCHLGALVYPNKNEPRRIGGSLEAYSADEASRSQKDFPTIQEDGFEGANNQGYLRNRDCTMPTDPLSDAHVQWSSTTIWSQHVFGWGCQHARECGRADGGCLLSPTFRLLLENMFIVYKGWNLTERLYFMKKWH